MEMGRRKRKFVTASPRTCLVTSLILTASINEPYYSITLVLHIHAGQITLGHVNRETVKRRPVSHILHALRMLYPLYPEHETVNTEIASLRSH